MCKKNLSHLFLFALISVPVALIAQNKLVPQLGKSSVKEVIAAMTLEEKATLVEETALTCPVFLLGPL